MCVGRGRGGGAQAWKKTLGIHEIYSTLNKCPLSTYYATDIVWHNGETSINETGDVIVFMDILGERINDDKCYEGRCLRQIGSAQGEVTVELTPELGEEPAR